LVAETSVFQLEFNDHKTPEYTQENNTSAHLRASVPLRFPVSVSFSLLFIKKLIPRFIYKPLDIIAY